MRILILNADYGPFLRWLYSENPELSDASYDRQLEARSESLFGVADFYSHNLEHHGHEAQEIHTNNGWMQAAWARENSIRPADWRLAGKRSAKQLLGAALSWIRRSPAWWSRDDQEGLTVPTQIRYEILAAQIRSFQPDVLLNQAMDVIPPAFIRQVREHTELTVGQVAAPLPWDRDYSCYDLVLSSLPNFVERFETRGIDAHLHRFAFDRRVLDRVDEAKRTIPVSFVGSLSPHHEARVKLLTELAKRVPLAYWGPRSNREDLPAPLAEAYEGEAWGREMYEVFRRSKITLNHHIDISGPYANNMRMFEATGTGPLLVTDQKENLDRIFVPGEEVVTYNDPADAAEKIRFYLKNEKERRSIARKGHERTLESHNYVDRMAELGGLLERAWDSQEPD